MAIRANPQISTTNSLGDDNRGSVPTMSVSSTPKGRQMARVSASKGSTPNRAGETARQSPAPARIVSG